MGVGGYIFTAILVIALAGAVLAMVWRGRRGGGGTGHDRRRAPDRHVLEARALAERNAHQNQNFGPF